MDGSLYYHFEQELEIGLRDALGLRRWRISPTHKSELQLTTVEYFHV